MPYIILVAGIPAAGKTTYARHITKKLHIPFIGKDNIKEKLHDVLQYDTSKQGNSKLYGSASYSVFFHIAECLMKVDVSFVLESNFTPDSAEILAPLVQKYNYRALTVLFDADMEVLHKRFCERDITDERHPGLRSKSGINNDFEHFKSGTLPLRDFCVGDKITVDTTDFLKVDYGSIDCSIINFIENE